MLLGKYLKYALVGSSLATVAAAEESKRKGRKLGNRKNRGYTGGGGKVNTLSPTMEVSYGSDTSITKVALITKDRNSFFVLLRS